MSAKKPRRLGAVLVGAGFAADIAQISVGVDIPGTVTRSVPLFKAVGKMKARDATYMQEVSPDGTKLIKIRNETKAVDITADLDIDAITGALSGADFVMVTVESDLEIADGDLISLVYTVTVAGTVSPDAVTVTLEVQLKD